MRNHLIGAALERQEFAGVVIAEADVVGNLDAAADGGEEGREEGFGVEVGGLDEDGTLGVADGGEERFVLGVVDHGVVGCWNELAWEYDIGG